ASGRVPGRPGSSAEQRQESRCDNRGTLRSARGKSAEVRGRVARERLVRKVGDALERGAVILTAGAGCGKTTVLEQVAAKSQRPVAWVGCAESDRVPGALLMRIVEAISRAVP